MSNERDFWNSGIFAPKTEQTKPSITVENNIEINIPTPTGAPQPDRRLASSENLGNRPSSLLNLPIIPAPTTSVKTTEIFLVMGVGAVTLAGALILRVAPQLIIFTGGAIAGGMTASAIDRRTRKIQNSRAVEHAIDKYSTLYAQQPGATLEGLAALDYFKKSVEQENK